MDDSQKQFKSGMCESEPALCFLLKVPVGQFMCLLP
jgi:hypothetical protein